MLRNKRILAERNLHFKKLNYLKLLRFTSNLKLFGSSRPEPSVFKSLSRTHRWQSLSLVKLQTDYSEQAFYTEMTLQCLLKYLLGNLPKLAKDLDTIDCRCKCFLVEIFLMPDICFHDASFMETYLFFN